MATNASQIDPRYFTNSSKYRRVKRAMKKARTRKIRRTKDKPLVNRYDGWLY